MVEGESCDENPSRYRRLGQCLLLPRVQSRWALASRSSTTMRFHILLNGVRSCFLHPVIHVSDLPLFKSANCVQKCKNWFGWIWRPLTHFLQVWAVQQVYQTRWMPWVIVPGPELRNAYSLVLSNAQFVGPVKQEYLFLYSPRNSQLRPASTVEWQPQNLRVNIFLVLNG